MSLFCRMFYECLPAQRQFMGAFANGCHNCAIIERFCECSLPYAPSPRARGRIPHPPLLAMTFCLIPVEAVAPSPRPRTRRTILTLYCADINTYVLPCCTGLTAVHSPSIPGVPRVLADYLTQTLRKKRS